MSATGVEAVRQIRAAQRSGDEADVDALRAVVTDDLTFVDPFVTLEDRDVVLRMIVHGPQDDPFDEVLRKIEWSEPASREDGLVEMVGPLPPGLPLPVKELLLTFSFADDGRVNRIDLAGR